MPALSVVIPTYNAAPFLREALDSLLAQTFTDWEAVCVNDGSTDKSLEIMQEYAARDKRFRILDGPNGGYGKAMNRGMDAAQGEYMAIFEPDDILPPTAYEKLVNKARESGADITRGCLCRFWRQGEDTAYEYVKVHAPKGKLLKPLDEQGLFSLSLDTVCCVYKLTLLRGHEIRYNETPGAAYQDTGMFFLSYAHAASVALIDDIVYMYRVDNPNSSINTADSKVPLIYGEFKYIRGKLEQYPERWERLKEAYVTRFFLSMLWFCTRLADHAKRDFLQQLRNEMIALKPLGYGGIPEYARRDLGLVLQAPEAYLAHKAVRQDLNSLMDSVQQLRRALPVKDTPFVFRSRERVAYRFLFIPLAGKYNTTALTRWSLFGIPVIRRCRRPLYACPVPGIRVAVSHEDVYSIFGIPVKRKPVLQ